MQTRPARADRPEVDLRRLVGLTAPWAGALRRYLHIDDDESFRHDFVFGKSVHRMYSDNAYRQMKAALDGGVNMDDVWQRFRPGGPGRAA